MRVTSRFNWNPLIFLVIGALCGIPLYGALAMWVGWPLGVDIGDQLQAWAAFGSISAALTAVFIAIAIEGWKSHNREIDRIRRSTALAIRIRASMLKQFLMARELSKQESGTVDTVFSELANCGHDGRIDHLSVIKLIDPIIDIPDLIGESSVFIGFVDNDLEQKIEALVGTCRGIARWKLLYEKTVGFFPRVVAESDAVFFEYKYNINFICTVMREQHGQACIMIEDLRHCINNFLPTEAMLID